MISDMIFVWPLDGDQVFCNNSKTSNQEKKLLLSDINSLLQ